MYRSFKPEKGRQSLDQGSTQTYFSNREVFRVFS